MVENISIVSTDAEIQATKSMMEQLHPNLRDLSMLEYVQTVKLQQKEVGYRLAVLSDQDRAVCAAGFRICRSLAWRKFLYVDDLVTEDAHRSRGFGDAMFAWLIGTARDCNCDELRLDAATYRTAAHRFYLRERMEIAAFHFKLPLH